MIGGKVTKIPDLRKTKKTLRLRSILFMQEDVILENVSPIK